MKRKSIAEPGRGIVATTVVASNRTEYTYGYDLHSIGSGDRFYVKGYEKSRRRYEKGN